MESVLLDAAGHRRSPATMPGYHRGRPPRNKGEEYPADPPTVEEIVAVMRTVGDRPDGHRLRALIVLLWRAGLRISEALALQESDLDSGRGAVLVRRGKGGKRREVGMDRWAWQQLDPWLEIRRELPIGALRRVPPLRAAPAPTRPRGRDGARRRAARRDPAPARARQPRHHQHLPAGHRQQRDRQHRPWEAVADDLRQRRPTDEALAISATRVGRLTAPTRRHTPGWRKPGKRQAPLGVLLCSSRESVRDPRCDRNGVPVCSRSRDSPRTG